MPSRRFVADAAERVAWTAAQAAAGALIDMLSTGHVSWRTVGYAAGLAALKAIAARRVGSSDSASTLRR